MIKNTILLLLITYCGLSLSQTKVVSPSNNQSFETNESINITWNAKQYNRFYTIQISNDSNFLSLLVNLRLTTNTYQTSFPSIGNYYLRVRSNNDLAWSKVQFKIIKGIQLIPGLYAWFSADTLLDVSGSSINSWQDRKNNARFASQTNQPNKPLFQNLCQLNNKPTLKFSGTSFLDLNVSMNTPLFSMYMLRNIQPGNPTAQYVLASDPDGGIYAEQAAADQGPGVFFPYSGINFFYNESPRDTSFFIYNHTSNAIYRNNNLLKYSGQTISNQNFVRIGARGSTLGLTGNIAEIIYFDRILDSTDNNTVTQYLSKKYSTPVSFGLDSILSNSLCDSIIIQAPCNKTYRWSNGATTQTIKVPSNNTYGLWSEDYFGNSGYDEISTYPYRRLGNKTIVICQGESVTVDLATPNNFTLLWNTGANTKSITINNSGQYIVKITDPLGCSLFDTLNVLVNQISLSSPVINNNLTACAGEKLFLLALTEFDSIRWSDNSANNNLILNTSGTYSVYARTYGGCILHDTFNVTIAGQAPTADFTSSSLCQNAITNFTDLSAPPAGDVITSWKWNFSNNNVATLQNPSTIFTALGTVSAALKITTNRGCSDSLFKTFTVYKRPKAGFFNLLACSGNPTTFVDTSRAGSGTLSTYFWNFAGLGFSNNITPVFSFPDVATYNVFHQLTNSYGCTDTITRPVYINPSPVSNFTFDSVCVGGTSYTSFKYLPTIQSPFTIDIFNWDFGDGVQNNSVKNPTHTFPGAGVYNVQLYVQASNQCVDTIQKEVRVFEPVNVDFVTSATQCVGKNIQFTDISTSQGLPISNWNWFFAGEGSSSVQNPTHAFNQQGNYEVQLTASNSIGCSGTKQRSIAVSDVPAPNFTFTPSYGLPPLVVNYTNLSPANGAYIWSYGDGTLPVTGYNPPAHTYSGVGTYPIKLISTNYRGCTDSIIKYILVDQAYIDGVMVEVRLIPNGDFYKIQVAITNNSNIEITQMGLSIQLGNGSVIRENWTGSILPSQTINYSFSGEIKLANENAIPVICASIDNINNQSAENRTDNNTTCKEISIGNFDVITIYPNPANESATFGIMLPRDGKVTILLIDALGQIEYKTAFNGVKGYNNLNVSLLPLNAGIYIAEIIYDNNILYRKLERSDKK